MNKNKFANTPNPWAICTESVGRDSADYEKCVMDVKKQYGLSEDMAEESETPKLPVYKLSVNECGDGTCSTEATAIALVSDPAIEVDFIAFSKETKKPKEFNFKVQDSTKHMLIGPIMLADTPIYRKNPETNEEYYVTFDSDSISNIMKNFSKRGYNKNINIQHNDEDMVNGAYLLEMWQVVDPKVDKLYSYGFKNITPGSFAGIIYCPNDEVWNQYITTGALKGFSIEGVFEMSSKPIQTFKSQSKLEVYNPNEQEKIIDEITKILLKK